MPFPSFGTRSRFVVRSSGRFNGCRVYVFHPHFPSFSELSTGLCSLAKSVSKNDNGCRCLSPPPTAIVRVVETHEMRTCDPIEVEEVWSGGFPDEVGSGTTQLR